MAPHPVPGGVLALDLSSTVGWCYGHVGQGMPPRSGRWMLKVTGELERDRYMRLSNAVWEALDQWRPSRLIVEAPLHIAAMHHDGAARQQLGLRAIVLCESSRAETPIPEEYSADLVRQEMLGRSHFPKGTVKRHVIQWARDNGFRPADDNEADAICLWSYYDRQIKRGSRGKDPAIIFGLADV